MRRREFIAGLAAAWPTVTRAQQPLSLPMIGLLSIATEDASRTRQGAALQAAFRRGLGEAGFIEGRNVEILSRWAEARPERLPAILVDLISRRVAVIVTTGGAASALAAQRATSTIPIVFQMASDPVALGLVGSLNRPGGNITGATFIGSPLIAKRFEVLHETMPMATTIAYLTNPNGPDDGRISDTESAARVLGVTLQTFKVAKASEIDEAFAIIAQRRIRAALIDNDSLFFGLIDHLVRLAERHAVAAMYYGRDFVDAGGLMSYGTPFPDAWRVAGAYAGRILKGERPGDLPVQQTTKVDLVLNLKAAKALGLTFPISLLGRADEVIE